MIEQENSLRIRAHHGLCFSFFRGKGYSETFTENMNRIFEQLKENPSILLIDHADDVCSACPNYDGVQCKDAALVKTFDDAVLSRCGLSAETTLSWKEFKQRVDQNILKPGKRGEICGCCEWNDLCSSLEQSEK